MAPPHRSRKKHSPDANGDYMENSMDNRMDSRIDERMGNRIGNRINNSTDERIPVHVRPEYVPESWRLVDDRLLSMDSPDVQGRRLVPTAKECELWRLCLCAKNIPHMTSGKGADMYIYVPALYEEQVRRDLWELSREKPRQRVAAPVYKNAQYVLFTLLLLILWHGFRMNWWGSSGLDVTGIWNTDTSNWSVQDLVGRSTDWTTKLLEQGKISVPAVLSGEWWRLATSLTLHSDSNHLFGNILFGAPVLILLARRISFGPAFFLTICSGMLGNLLNVFYRPLYHQSVGFSTALFASIGILCADAAIAAWLHRDSSLKQRLAQVLVAVAAGFALLAMLGTSGEHTDYAAHIFGLLSGLALGAGYSLISQRFPLSRLHQAAMGLAAFLLLILCWVPALV